MAAGKRLDSVLTKIGWLNGERLLPRQPEGQVAYLLVKCG